MLPPDTGYDLKMANELYAAEAAVLGGQAVAGRRARRARRGARPLGHGSRVGRSRVASARPAPIAPMRRLVKPDRRLTPWLFLAPGLLVFGAAVLLPMVLTIGYSFTDWNGFGPMTFVGLDNYARALDDPRLPRRRSCTSSSTSPRRWSWRCWSGWASPGSSRMRRGGLWFRVAIFTPVMLPMVVVAVLWSFVYNPDFGLHQRAASRRSGWSQLQRIWLGDPSTALLAISVVSGWVYAGFYMMIFYAAFRQVPGRGHRGGAPRWRRRVGALPARQGAHDPGRHRRSRSCSA